MEKHFIMTQQGGLSVIESEQSTCEIHAEVEQSQNDHVCVYTDDEMIAVIEQTLSELEFSPILVQSKLDGIPDEPILCLSLNGVKKAVLELAISDSIFSDYPDFEEEIMACGTVDDIDEHPVLTSGEDYNMVIRFMRLDKIKR